MKRRLALALVVSLGVAIPAQGVTIRDLIELTKAGLGEEVLLALVEVDRGVFPVDAETLRSLKEAGVPERVIAAVVRSGRMPQPAPPQPAPEVYDAGPPAPYVMELPGDFVTPPEPSVIYVQSPPETIVQEVPVPYYVTVPVGSRSQHRRPSAPGATVVPSITPPPALQGPTHYQTDRPAPASPAYWGSGGKLRPDAWQPAGSSAWGRRDRGEAPTPDKDGNDGKGDKREAKGSEQKASKDSGSPRKPDGRKH